VVGCGRMYTETVDGNGSPSATVPSASPVGTATPESQETIQDALVAAALDAGLALKDLYEESRVIGINPQDPTVGPVSDLYEAHGFIDGTTVTTETGISQSVVIELNVLGSASDAEAFHAGHRERTPLHDPVDVPGWPRPADLNFYLGTIWYSFVYGPAWVRVLLSHHLGFESREAAVAELSAELGEVLDVVLATLTEKVPLDR
jgi:hypothetical protein